MNSADCVSHEAAASTACAAQVPLVPPSPYKPGARAMRPRPSTLPSLFANKMGILEAQDMATAKDREAVRRVEQMMERRTNPLQKRAASANTATAAGPVAAPDPNSPIETTAAQQPEDPEATAKAKARAESMQLTLFFVVKCQQVDADESIARAQLSAEEELAALHLEMVFLEGRQQLLAETLSAEKAEQLAMLQDDKVARVESRDTQLRLIESEVARESMERRLAEALRQQIDMVFPQYLLERRDIEEAEEEDLAAAFQWHAKNRPLGPGCFIKGPEEDPRIRYGSLSKPRKMTAARARSVASAKERSLSYRERLRSRASTALVVVDSDTEAEMTYADEGRQLLQDEKLRLHEHIRRTRAMEYLIEEEQEERVEIQHEEAQEYQPIAAFGVDDMYAVRAVNHEQKLARDRALDAIEDQENAEDDAALRARIRAQLQEERAQLEACPEPLQIEAAPESM